MEVDVVDAVVSPVCLISVVMFPGVLREIPHGQEPRPSSLEEASWWKQQTQLL